MKQVVVHFDFPNTSKQQYDAVWDGIRAKGITTPKGLIFHVGAQTPNGGLFVTDVWESEEAFKEFGKTLIPLIEQQGIAKVVPTIMPVYYVHQGQPQVASR